jgi:hypothetical protein
MPMRNLLACAGFMLAVVVGFSAGIREGMTLDEVEANLGAPLSSMNKGDTMVLLFPHQGRVELVGGKVTKMSHVLHADDPATPEELAAAEAEKAKAETQAEEAKAAKERTAAEAAWQKANAENQRKIEAAVEQMSKDGSDGHMAEKFDLKISPLHFWVELGVGLLLQVGVGMLILKLAFSWTDVHADWGQMFLPALASGTAGALVRGAAYALWNTNQLFRLDDAVSYGALLFVLMKTTHACTWQRAVGVAMAAKLMGIVVWVFLSVALSRMLFA